MTITIFRDGYKYDFRTIYNNPYYTQTLVGPSTDNNELEDLGMYLLEYPIGPEYINNQSWWYAGYTEPDGTYHSVGSVAGFALLREGDEYWVQSYTWPNGDNGRTSKPLKLKVKTPCANRNSVQLQWENEYGAFDFYEFEYNRTLTDKTKTSTFRQVRDEMNMLDGETEIGYYGHSDFSRGEKTYHQDVETLYTLNSDYLTAAELESFRDLWSSKNVFAYIDGKWYPVIAISKEKTIQSDIRQLPQLQFNIRLSNKIYK